MSFFPLPDITLSGSTPGAVVGESVELGPPFVLKNGDAFTITVRVVASGLVSPSSTLLVQSFVQRFAVRRDSGVTTVVASGVVDQFGDAGASSWTATVSAGTGPDRLKIIFTTGSTIAHVSVEANVFLTRSVTPAAPAVSPLWVIGLTSGLAPQLYLLDPFTLLTLTSMGLPVDGPSYTRFLGICYVGGFVWVGAEASGPSVYLLQYQVNGTYVGHTVVPGMTSLSQLITDNANEIYIIGAKVLRYDIPSTTFYQVAPGGSGNYTITSTTGASIVAGGTDVGNHADDGTTLVTFPWSLEFYDQTWATGEVCSNGNLQFNSNNNTYSPSVPPTAALNTFIAPYWMDLRTDGVGDGWFALTTGVMPNRTYYLELKAHTYSGGYVVHNQIVFHEGSPNFEIVYESTSSASGGVIASQRDTGSHYTTYQVTGPQPPTGTQLAFVYSAASGGLSTAFYAAIDTAFGVIGFSDLGGTSVGWVQLPSTVNTLPLSGGLGAIDAGYGAWSPSPDYFWFQSYDTTNTYLQWTVLYWQPGGPGPFVNSFVPPLPHMPSTGGLSQSWIGSVKYNATTGLVYMACPAADSTRTNGRVDSINPSTSAMATVNNLLPCNTQVSLVYLETKNFDLWFADGGGNVSHINLNTGNITTTVAVSPGGITGEMVFTG